MHLFRVDQYLPGNAPIFAFICFNCNKMKCEKLHCSQIYFNLTWFLSLLGFKLNPSKLEKNEDVNLNLAHLLNILSELVEKIFLAAEILPP